MVHGHGGGQGDHAGHSAHGGREPGAVRDPVCGMEVASGQGYTKTHGGREYRFCWQACLDKFNANPEQYESQQGGIR